LSEEIITTCRPGSDSRKGARRASQNQDAQTVAALQLEVGRNKVQTVFCDTGLSRPATVGQLDNCSTQKTKDKIMHREENKMGSWNWKERARDTTNKEERLCLVYPAAAASGQQVELNSVPTTDDAVAPSFGEQSVIVHHT
jgi:GMP synthase PP-ATPase subunit